MVICEDKAVFPGYYSSLVKIAEFVKQASLAAGFDSAAAYHIELALDEAVTNVIEHAYGGEGIGEIEVGYSVDPRRLTFLIVDHGKPFKPAEIEKPDIKAPLSSRSGHGLGLFLVNRLMDEVQFEFNLGSGNKLTLIKYRD